MNICNEFQYNNKNIIGTGAFSTVYRGLNLKTNEIVAIKKITNYKKDKYIFNEIELLTQLKDEDNIITLINYYNIDNIIYLVFNYCSMSLDKYIKNNKCIEESVCQNYFSQIVNALKILYSKNIYHRDIKPSNILIENDRIYLCDFGLAKIIQIDNLDNIDIKQSIVGSPLFISPEIYSDLKYDLKSDLWSLGLVLFEMLSGYNYLNSKNMTELISKIKSKDIPHINNISIEVKDLLNKLLNKNVNDRISWNELFKHNWIINDIKIEYSYRYVIEKSEEYYNDYLIVSMDNEMDQQCVSNSYSFVEVFENSIEAIKNLIL
jgi:serine/threonine protein kinase